MESLGQLLDVLRSEVAFSVENAVAEADVRTQESGEVAGGEVVFGEEKLECFQT